MTTQTDLNVEKRRQFGDGHITPGKAVVWDAVYIVTCINEWIIDL